jgi:hypothetical protein
MHVLCVAILCLSFFCIGSILNENAFKVKGLSTLLDYV